MNNDKVNKILMGIIAGLLLAILVGTVMGLVSKRNNKPEVLISKGKAENLAPPVDTTEIAYFDLGRMRIIPESEGQPSLEDSQHTKGDRSNTNGDGQPSQSERLPSDGDGLSTVMVLTPWLAYPAGDTVFYEELSRKQGVIKSVFTTYFASKSKNQILSIPEEKNISVLMEEINKKLSLGKISNIFFTDYIFLE